MIAKQTSNYKNKNIALIFKDFIGSTVSAIERFLIALVSISLSRKRIISTLPVLTTRHTKQRHFTLEQNS